MKHRIFIILIFIAFISIFTFIALNNISKNTNLKKLGEAIIPEKEEKNPLMIDEMRAKSYAGSDLTIEQELGLSSNYKKYIASYKSDGLKIYGLLTVPQEAKPGKGYPAIIFNHGYIPPEQYKTIEKYADYVDGFASNGYVVFKPDYRGHGDSEGKPEGGYFSPAYTSDVLNALASIKKLKDPSVVSSQLSIVDPNKIGMWGHSLGGHLTLRAMVISKDIRAGVIWGGVVGTYQEIFDEWWNRRVGPTFTPSQRERQANRPTRQSFIEKFGEPADSSEFWRSISPNFYLKDISGPIQLHHGTADETVPYTLSEKLYNRLRTAGKEVEYYTYEGADHNISSPAFELAIERSIEFFDKYLK